LSCLPLGMLWKVLQKSCFSSNVWHCRRRWTVLEARGLHVAERSWYFECLKWV
jgi:hypothetical protein